MTDDSSAKPTPKFGSLHKEAWIRHDYPKAYAVQQAGGQPRLCIAVGSDGSGVLEELSLTLQAPFFLLYVLVVPRGGSAAGRYQSPELRREELSALFARFGQFWDSDGRHSVWLRSIPEGATLVYDRHNLLYAYGPTGRLQTVLERLGYHEVSEIEIPKPHQHSYLSDYDVLEQELASLPDWYRTDLREGDEA